MIGVFQLPHNLRGNISHRQNDYHAREQVWFIINRAYQNLYGVNLPAQPEYQKTIFDAALALKRDSRCDNLSDKHFIQLCEDIIRVADEHTRLAQKHASRASNPVYLRETALDNAIEKQKYLNAIGANKPENAILTSKAHEARLYDTPQRPSVSSAEIMELAYRQLALDAKKA